MKRARQSGYRFIENRCAILADTSSAAAGTNATAGAAAAVWAVRNDGFPGHRSGVFVLVAPVAFVGVHVVAAEDLVAGFADNGDGVRD